MTEVTFKDLLEKHQDIEKRKLKLAEKYHKLYKKKYGTPPNLNMPKLNCEKLEILIQRLNNEWLLDKVLRSSWKKGGLDHLFAK